MRVFKIFIMELQYASLTYNIFWQVYIYISLASKWSCEHLDLHVELPLLSLSQLFLGCILILKKLEALLVFSKNGLLE